MTTIMMKVTMVAKVLAAIGEVLVVAIPSGGFIMRLMMCGV